MELRSRPISVSAASVALAALVVAALALPGRASAGAADYASPLYLSGAASTQITTTTSYKLVTALGPVAPAPAPTAAAGIAGAITSGSYVYLYTVVDPVGGETFPSLVSNSVSVSAFTGNKQINVSGLPTGVTVRLYRQRSGSFFYRIASLTNNASSTYVDNAPENTMLPILPRSQNRVALSTVGYLDFAPGGYAHTTNNSALATTPLAATGQGWVVDGAGRVHFAAGAWSFEAKVENGGNTNGEAYLVVGVWKITTSAGAIGTATATLDPNSPAAQNGTNLITTAASTQTITHTAALPAFDLAANEHLYVQFWRRQQVQMTTGGTPNRLLTMRTYDGTARITHPGVSTLPDVPALAAPADAAVTDTQPALSALFTDPDGDTGTVEFRVCSDPGCASVQATGTAGPVASGATAAWTPSIAAGTYYWQARAEDAIGGRSDWSAARSFRLNAEPDVPVLQAPVNADVANAQPSLAALFNDPDGDDPGSVEFRVCADTSCATILASGSPAALASGGTAQWAPSPALGPGTYYWQARAQDARGIPSAWSAARSFRINATPNAPVLEAPADAAATNSEPALAAIFSDPDGDDPGTVSFRVCSYPGCPTVQASGTAGSVANGATASWTPSVAPGTYYWQARAEDALGGQSSWSAVRSFRLNAPPDVPTLQAPANALVADAQPTLAALFDDSDGDDPGSVAFRVCTDASCATIVASGSPAPLASGGTAQWAPSPALGPGTYYWQARAQDARGITSAWSARRSFRINAKPNPPVLEAPADAAVTNTEPSLAAVFSDPDAGDPGTVQFRVCSDAACTAVEASGAGASVANGATASWAIGARLQVGTYYWQARADDALGGVSSWTGSRRFRLNARPASPTSAFPAAGAQVRDASPRLTAMFLDPEGDRGTVRFRICRTASPAGVVCKALVRAGSSSAVASGSAGAWTAARNLADGTYFWQARSRDETGAISPWSATSRVTIARRLIRIVSARRLTCVVGATLQARVKLAAPARVTAFLRTRSRLDDTHGFDPAAAGTRTLRLPLKWSLERPAVYWIKWKAVGDGETSAASMRVDLRRFTGAAPPACRADRA